MVSAKLVSCESLTYCNSNAATSRSTGTMLMTTNEKVTPLRYLIVD